MTNDTAPSLITASAQIEAFFTAIKLNLGELGNAFQSINTQLGAFGADTVARIKAWSNELFRAREVTKEVAAEAAIIDKAVEDGLNKMFVAISSGAKSAKEAFGDFAQSVLQAIMRIAAQKLASSLFSLFAGEGSGGISSFGTLIATVLNAFTSGNTSAAGASGGNALLSTGTMQQVGEAFVQSINDLSAGPRSATPTLPFAAEDLDAETTAAPAAGQAVRIVNVIDPAMAGDYLNSSAGEKTILNILQRNAGAVRQVLS